jgi:hypothetical protein
MFGVAYYDFPVTKSHQVPFNGMPSLGIGSPPLQQIQGSTGSFEFPSLATLPDGANRFAAAMVSGGWQQGFKYGSQDFTLNDMRKQILGGNEIFGNVTVGLYMSHGFYGTAPDYHADLGNNRAMGCFDTYTVSDNSSDAGQPWLRLTEFGFDGSLRYMALFSCWLLTDANQNFSNMQSLGVLPIPPSLHILCGATTLVPMTPDVGEKWAVNMIGKKGFLGIHKVPAMTVQNAWFQAGNISYEAGLGTNFFLMPVYFRVAGWTSTMNDYLTNANDTTSGNIQHQDFQVH